MQGADRDTRDRRELLDGEFLHGAHCALSRRVRVKVLRLVLRPWLTSSSSPLHNYIGVVTDGFLLFI
jgi:hypothetical protein